jgi:hypothetical protein
MTLTMTISTHDIRLETRAGRHQGTCSCGWASADDLTRAVAASAAVRHSISCAGDALMGGDDRAFSQR